MTANASNSESKASGNTASSAKQQLPKTQFFYQLAMRRSAEIKSQGESVSRPANQSQEDLPLLGAIRYDSKTF